MPKNEAALFLYWHVPFIEVSSKRCTSGLVAGSHEVKSTLRSSLLEGDCCNAWMAGCPDHTWWLMSHLAAEALWVLMHINEIGCCYISTVTFMNKAHALRATHRVPLTELFTSHRPGILQQEWPSETVAATSPIHGLWEFQELYQAKSWNGRKPWGQWLCE